MNSSRIVRRHDLVRGSVVRRGLCLAMFACLQLGPFAAVFAQDATTQEFDIERLPIVEALTQFYQQTSPRVGFQYLPTDAEEEKALVGPLKGRYSLEAALQILLAPAGFSFEWIDERRLHVISPGADR